MVSATVSWWFISSTVFLSGWAGRCHRGKSEEVGSICRSSSGWGRRIAPPQLVCPFYNTRSYAKLGNFSETFHESKGVGKFIYPLSIRKSQPLISRGALALTIATWGALRPFFRRKNSQSSPIFQGTLKFKTEVFFKFGNELILSRHFREVNPWCLVHVFPWSVWISCSKMLFFFPLLLLTWCRGWPLVVHPGPELSLRRVPMQDARETYINVCCKNSHNPYIIHPHKNHYKKCLFSYAPPIYYILHHKKP